MKTGKNQPIRKFLFQGRIFRTGFTQANKGGGPTEPTETNIIPSIIFARGMPESEEEYKAGTFEGRRQCYLYFRNPGWDVLVQEGDKVEITIWRKLTVWNIDSLIIPDTGRDDFCLECSRKVTKVVAPAP